jgi:two-component system nitrate/nitrite response regulator NarL
MSARSSSALALRTPVRISPEGRRDKPLLEVPPCAIAIAIVGGTRLLREATASLLNAQDGLRITDTYESAAHFLAIGADSPPTVLLLDSDGHDPDSWRATVASLSCADIKSKIVMFCQEMREDVLRCTVEHGLSGVILKSYTTDEVRAAIEYLATGRTVMPAGWQRVVAGPLTAALSPRQREILALIADGRCTDDIAAELGVSSNTIKFHIRMLYSRLGVRNRVEAANRYAQMSHGGA